MTHSWQLISPPVSIHLRSSPGAVGHVGAALPPEATTPARVGRGEAAAAGDSQRHCPSAAGAQAAGVSVAATPWLRGAISGQDERR